MCDEGSICEIAVKCAHTNMNGTLLLKYVDSNMMKSEKLCFVVMICELDNLEISFFMQHGQTV